MLCVDNTEFSRNGDFTPSRFGAQQDVIQTLCRAKIRSHAENNVGLLATGGKKPKLVNTLTSDTNKLLTGFAKLEFSGEENNFSVSLRTAHLALKHRISKNHRQRIVIMVCSPLIETESELVKLAKKLKKENVSVDVINFGEDEQNVERLVKFIETLNGKNADPTTVNCHLINIPSGSNVNDAVRNSAICGATQPASTGISGGATGMALGGDDDWMNDPNMDPELALALRVSLEESRARQQQENQASSSANTAGAGAAAGTGAAAGNSLAPINEEATNTATAGAAAAGSAGAPATAAGELLQEDDMEDEDIMAALQMSLANPGGNDDDDEDDGDVEDNNEDGNDDDDETNADTDIATEANLATMTEEEQIEFALRMSMAEAENGNEEGEDEMGE